MTTYVIFAIVVAVIVIVVIAATVTTVVAIVGADKETKRQIKELKEEHEARAEEAWRELQSKEIISQWNDLGFVGDLIYEGHDMYYISSEYGDKWMKIDRKEVHALISYFNTFQS